MVLHHRSGMLKKTRWECYPKLLGSVNMSVCPNERFALEAAMVGRTFSLGLKEGMSPASVSMGGSTAKVGFDNRITGSKD